MGRIIERDRSIIPALDMSWYDLGEVVAATARIDAIGAYKIGFFPVFTGGLTSTVMSVKDILRNKDDVEKPVIYDHQKAGTDIPATGKNFADAMAWAKVDAAILFPQAGPETEKAWIEALQERDIGVIVGGWMTHKAYLSTDGGYIDADRVLDIYLLAADLGVADFVVPGNQPDAIRQIKESLEGRNVEPTFYSPGLVAQGGDISESAKAAGDRWHAIVGRGIYNAGGFEEMHEAAVKYGSQL